MSAAKILLLAGTLEASLMAKALADANLAAIASYAGRVDRPKPLALPKRVGGFGGIAGLLSYLQREKITHLIDATHPFAAQMSANAVAATQQLGIPMAALTRAPWQATPEDSWTQVPDIPNAVAALAGAPRRVLLAIGRMHLDAFMPQAQHHYVLRLVDPPQTPPDLPNRDIIISRGPFTTDGDMGLIRKFQIDVIVSKNAGGTGAIAKILAARALRLPVIMIERPQLPARLELHDTAAVLRWISYPHETAFAQRGV